MTDSNQPAQSSRWPAVLFVSAGVAFIASVSTPAIRLFTDTPAIPGLVVLYTTVGMTLQGVWQIVTGNTQDAGDVLAPLMGTLANLTLLASAVLGQRLIRKQSVTMLCLSINGVAAGALTPWVMGMTFNELYIGYWLWIASLALVAAGWWSVVWNQRRMRVVFRHDTRSSTTI